VFWEKGSKRVCCFMEDAKMLIQSSQKLIAVKIYANANVFRADEELQVYLFIMFIFSSCLKAEKYQLLI
jgi:hypothetical protein